METCLSFSNSCIRPKISNELEFQLILSSYNAYLKTHFDVGYFFSLREIRRYSDILCEFSLHLCVRKCVSVHKGLQFLFLDHVSVLPCYNSATFCWYWMCKRNRWERCERNIFPFIVHPFNFEQAPYISAILISLFVFCMCVLETLLIMKMVLCSAFSKMMMVLAIVVVVVVVVVVYI